MISGLYGEMSSGVGCVCCPRRCGVCRENGETGYCRTGSDITVSHIGLHHGEEPPISGVNGSGTIFFAGCNLRCVFCQNYQISQEFTLEEQENFSPVQLADEMLKLEEKRAHNINLVSPSHFAPKIASAIESARGRGLCIPVVYNSNGYDSVETLKKLDGLIEIYLPDLKYSGEIPAKKYSAAPDYPDIAKRAIGEMVRQRGHLQLNDDGVAVSGVLVRHLVLPGFIDDSLSCISFLASLGKKIHVSIMSQYHPVHKAQDYPDLNRFITGNEYKTVVDHALELGLSNLYLQGLDSNEVLLPDFNSTEPFNS